MRANSTSILSRISYTKPRVQWVSDTWGFSLGAILQQHPDPSSSLKTAVFVVLCLTMGLATGCESTRTRPGVSESGGTYQWFAPADIARTWDAASEAAAELGYTVTHRHRPDRGDWRLGARDNGANQVTIELKPVSLEATRVAVTIDPGNNDSMSQLVIEAIRKQLESL